VAVDVEHSSKSYEGLTCLIQISSRKKDYIIDVFPIWRDMPLLKQIMENESIIKVMHGAEMDTKWLQRDFNIHIINLFDTHRASRVLGFPKLSYAYLLNYYCNQTTDKTYQLADWRQRPLSTEMLHYARLDTHFLL
jgi:exosome complex exonuclease RRP6